MRAYRLVDPHFVLKECKPGDMWRMHSLWAIFVEMDARLLPMRRGHVIAMQDYPILVGYAMEYLNDHPNRADKEVLINRIRLGARAIRQSMTLDRLPRAEYERAHCIMESFCVQAFLLGAFEI